MQSRTLGIIYVLGGVQRLSLTTLYRGRISECWSCRPGYHNNWGKAFASAPSTRNMKGEAAPTGLDREETRRTRFPPCLREAAPGPRDGCRRAIIGAVTTFTEGRTPKGFISYRQERRRNRRTPSELRPQPKRSPNITKPVSGGIQAVTNPWRRTLTKWQQQEVQLCRRETEPDASVGRVF